MLKIMGFPGEYIQGLHALSHMGEIATRHQFKHISIVYDIATEGAILEKITSALTRSNIDFHCFKFKGECSYANIENLSIEIGSYHTDAILALGGGKTIDTAKGITKHLNRPIIICPSIASNDAPTSRLIVVYDENHKVQAVEKTKCNPNIVVVDLDIISKAPVRFFAAGIGDAISKMFEANQCKKANGLNSFGTPALDTALLLANHTYENLITWGKIAYDSIEQHKITPAVERVIESTVLLSGLGFESGGLSLAHALIRGLTAVPQFSSKLHGELVAFGTIVQAILEQRDRDFIIQLTNFLKSIHLPTNFQDLGYSQAITDDILETITINTLNNSYSQNFQTKITKQNLKKALLQTQYF